MTLTARTATFVTLVLTTVLITALALVVTTPQPSQASGHQHCVNDPDDDVHDLAGSPAAGEGRADILEVCAQYETDLLTFSMRVADPTDPAADASWADGDTLAAFAIRADAAAYGGPSGQVFLRVEGGTFSSVATWFDDQTSVCNGTAELDGDWYRASFDPGCLDVPDTISYAGYLQYDADPASNNPATTFGDRAPEGPNSQEAVGRFTGPVTRSGVTPPFERLSGRFAGPTRIDTAVEISRSQFPHGAEEVYLARQDDFPDALAAGSLTRGPILLVRQCVLPQSVAFEIERLDPERVIGLGGTAAICDALLEEARSL